MIKWKCFNCDNEFTSETEEDYIEVLKKINNQEELDNI